MNKTQMEAQVSSIINRGTSFDSFIPGALRRAVTMLEENNNFKYMHQIRPFPKDPLAGGAAAVPTLELGVAELKRMNLLRYGLPGESGATAYTELEQADFGEIVSMPATQLPTFFFPNFAIGPSGGAAQQLLVLGTVTLPQAVTFEVEGFWYTNYDNLVGSITHWLLSKGETAIMAMAMIELAPIIRQPEVIQTWQILEAKGMKSLLLADDELIAGGRLESIHPGE